jgi:hypothetical protein
MSHIASIQWKRNALFDGVEYIDTDGISPRIRGYYDSPLLESECICWTVDYCPAQFENFHDAEAQALADSRP